MEYTKYFNFALPSRDTDDVADINVISENFRTVEAAIIEKTDGKLVSELTDEMIGKDLDGFASPSAVVNYTNDKLIETSETLKQYADETSVNMALNEIASATIKKLYSDMTAENSNGIPAPYAVVEYVDSEINDTVEQIGVFEYYNQDTEGFWNVGQIRKTGVLSKSGYYKRTDLLSVDEYVVENISILGDESQDVANIAYYDENKRLISYQIGAEIKSVIIPDNAHYMAFCLFINKENILTLKRNKVISSEIGLRETQALKQIDTLEYINKDTEGFWSEGHIDAVGYFRESTGYSRTELLPVNEYVVDEIYIVGSANGSVSSVAYYDENKQFISNQTGRFIASVIIPDNAHYMAFCLFKNQAADKLIIRRLRIGDVEDRLYAVELALDLKEDPLELKVDGGYTKIFRKIGVIGDSLASGAMTYYVDDTHTTTSGEDMYEYSWLQYIARTCGSIGYNFSKGGLSTRTFLQDVGGKATECYTDASKLCQAYFIALGHNDLNQSIPTGTSDDIDIVDYNNNADTYYGNYAKIIQKIKEIAPKAKIFVITMKNKYNEIVCAEYNAAIRYMATIFDNVYVLDMNIYFPDILDEHYTAGHGNAMGYCHYSLEIQTLVDKTIRENPTDFKYVQFINTEYENSEDYEPNT